MSQKSSVGGAMSPAEWGLLIALSVLWGGSFFFNVVAVHELPTFTVVVGRVALAAVILLLVMRMTRLSLPRAPQVWLAFFGMGFLNNVVPFSLIVWGQLHIASGLASILNATTPLFTVVVAHALTHDEKLTGGRIAGVLAGLAGVTVLVGGEVLGTLGTGGGITVVAQVAVLGAAFSYALAGVYGRRFAAMKVPPLSVATGQAVAASVLLVPVMLLVEAPWTLAMPGPATWAALIGLAALSSALAYLIYFRLLETAGATNLLLVTFLVPVSAILLGVGILDEVLLPRHLAGLALIALGLAAIDGRPLATLRRTKKGGIA